MSNASQDDILVHALCQLGQMLAYLNARNRCLNSVKFTSVFRGCIRLWVKCVHVRWATGKIDKDGCLRALRSRRCRMCPAQVIRERETTCTKCTKLQEVSTNDTITCSMKSHWVSPVRLKIKLFFVGAKTPVLMIQCEFFCVE